MQSSGRAERPAGPRICVFCGSSSGDDPIFRITAAAVGQELAARGAALVYGGGRVGCMGALADAALAAGGYVIGVIPEALAAREVAHGSLSELHLVASMHERKALMTKLCDAFLALPGGFGTLDELFEAVTWRQLGYHTKPAAVLNVDGYYDALQRFCDDAERAGFLRAADRAGLVFGDEAAPLLETLCAAIRAKRSPSP